MGLFIKAANRQKEVGTCSTIGPKASLLILNTSALLIGNALQVRTNNHGLTLACAE